MNGISIMPTQVIHRRKLSRPISREIPNITSISKNKSTRYCERIFEIKLKSSASVIDNLLRNIIIAINMKNKLVIMTTRLTGRNRIMRFGWFSSSVIIAEIAISASDGI